MKGIDTARRRLCYRRRRKSETYITDIPPN